MRVGLGYDIHPLVPGRKLIVGGVVIPAEFGPKGHSDGDVLYHALGDALLGAAALGDMGTHFPDTDPRWQGADSAIFLREILALVTAKGWKIENMDVNLHLETPKLKPHVASMVKNICQLLGVQDSQVNLKAKRGEGLDAVGRQEAIAAQVVVLLC